MGLALLTSPPTYPSIALSNHCVSFTHFRSLYKGASADLDGIHSHSGLRVHGPLYLTVPLRFSSVTNPFPVLYWMSYHPSATWENRLKSSVTFRVPDPAPLCRVKWNGQQN